MKISAFSFIRNGELLGYPYVASIQSVLPLVDEFVIAVGPCQDMTREQIEQLHEPKIKLIDTQWDDKLQQKGFVYAQQKMIALYNCTGDWAFYLEGDELVHESEIEKIRALLLQHNDNHTVEAIAFHYHHFYGSPHHVARSHAWYRQEVRIVRNHLRWFCPDGLFFVLMQHNKKGRYPTAIVSDCSIYHYGHVRPSAQMAEKVKRVGQYWGSNSAFSGYEAIPAAFVHPFTGTHPKAIGPWLEEHCQSDFAADPHYIPNKREKRHLLIQKLEAQWGITIGQRQHFKKLTLP